jgi:5-methylthioadenosine/S-adenosylhomocysteine deaminase
MGMLNRSLPEREANFVVQGAYAVTMDPTIGDIERSRIAIRNGEIVGVERSDRSPQSGEIDGSNMIALPGFVDTHWHLWSCALRGLHSYSDRDFGYFPLTMRVGPLYSALDSYRNVRLGAAEALLTGITTVHNWGHNILSPAHADAEIQAMAESGLRGHFSYGWGQNLSTNLPMNLADLNRIKERFSNDELLSLGVALRTPVAYQRGNVPLEILGKEWSAARQLGLPVTIHNRAGVVSILENAGLLDSDVLIVHPQAFTKDEIEILAKRKVRVSSSPVNENARGPNGPRGPIQLAELLDAEVNCSISVDEVVTNGKADFFSVMREGIRADWQRAGEHTKFSPRRMLQLATIDGARALGVADRIGSLTPGKRADVILVRADDLNLTATVGDPPGMLVFSGQPNNVDAVIVDGRILVRGGRLIHLDKAQIQKDAVVSILDLRARDVSLR